SDLPAAGILSQKSLTRLSTEFVSLMNAPQNAKGRRVSAPSASRGCPMALFVLLAAAARTRFVAPHFRLIAPHGLLHGIVAADPGRLLRLLALAARHAERARLRRLCAPGAEHRCRFGLRIVQNERRCPTRRGPPRDRGLLA